MGKKATIKQAQESFNNQEIVEKTRK